MSEGREIPKGWAETTLGEIISISSGKGLVQAKQVSDGEYFVYGGNGVVGKHNHYLFKEKQLIVGRVGVHCGNIHLTKIKSWVTDNAFVVSFNSKEIDINYLYWLIKVLNLNKYSSSTAQPVISQGKLYPIEIKFAPLPEQHRIVTKIEELFSSLDKGIESLKTAQEQLKVYRQAVLKWAFEGRLTNKDVKEGELPEEWNKVKVKQIGKVINGDRGKNYPSRSHYVSEGVPFISAGNIEENRIDLSSLNFITQQKYDALNSGKLQNGDIIYCLRGSLGKCAIYNLCQGAISSSLCILRLNDDVLKQFVFYYLVSPFGRDEILKHDNGTAQPNLSGKSFENYELFLPTLAEQHHIVSEIESRLSVCDKIEESIATSLLQAEALRQSILKKAFEGKLVEQDPEDEPASVLLERIKAEREALRKAQGSNKPMKIA